MIKRIIKGIFKLIMSLTSVLLTPINTIIQNFIPDLANVISGIVTLFDMAGQFLGFIMSIFGFNSLTWSIIVMYYVFHFGFQMGMFTVKLSLKWYNALKL